MLKLQLFQSTLNYDKILQKIYAYDMFWLNRDISHYEVVKKLTEIATMFF